MAEGIDKLPVLQGLRCFYLGSSFAGVAGAMIKAVICLSTILETGIIEFSHRDDSIKHQYNNSL